MIIDPNSPLTYLPRTKPNPFKDNDPTSHTTNPMASTGISPSLVPVTASGNPITSLRNRYHFPSAANLPHDDDIDKNYFVFNPTSRSFRPKKHWAYLGEIIAMEKRTRLHLTTRDMAGNEVPVWFYLDHFGHGRPKSSRFTKVDHTVAKTGKAVEHGVKMAVRQTIVVVYPELREFIDGTCGIRIDGDEMKGLKVIPYSLDELLMANDIIVSQKLSNFSPECNHCKKHLSGNRHVCGGCRVAYYCDKTCQNADWPLNPIDSPANTAGHKSACKLYREVRWFTDLDWNNYTFREGLLFSRDNSSNN